MVSYRRKLKRSILMLLLHSYAFSRVFWLIVNCDSPSLQTTQTFSIGDNHEEEERRAEDSEPRQ